MGEISGKIADYTIITSDNPRTEEPEQIIKDIEEGIKRETKDYTIVVDRKEAIKKAIEISHKRDMIIVAGKGHEMYQEVNGEKNPFNEREIIEKIINKK